jgi:hypothetical protein
MNPAGRVRCSITGLNKLDSAGDYSVVRSNRRFLILD